MKCTEIIISAKTFKIVSDVRQVSEVKECATCNFIYT